MNGKYRITYMSGKYRFHNVVVNNQIFCTSPYVLPPLITLVPPFASQRKCIVVKLEFDETLLRQNATRSKVGFGWPVRVVFTIYFLSITCLSYSNTISKNKAK